jgi:hypothetical protein
VTTKGVKEVVDREEHRVSGTPYDVATATPGPRTEYRATIDLPFSVPSPEARVTIDAQAARLDGSFGSLDQTITSGFSDNSVGDHKVVVAVVPEPREIRRVTLTAGHGGAVELFRIDKDRPATKPTMSVPMSGNSAYFAGFTDVRFAVGLHDTDLTKGEVASLVVRGQPTGPRLGLADPADPGDVAFFWPGPDDTGTTVQAGPAFAAALQAYLDARPGVAVTARLVIQSDQPCRFYLTHLAAPVAFAVDGFSFPLLGPNDLADEDALASRIRAADDPVAAYVRSRVNGGPLKDALNALIAGATIYDAGRFARVQLSPATQAALAGTDVPRLNRLLLEDAFDGLVGAAGDKRVLRFAELGDQAVSVRLPSGAHVTHAVVETEEGFESARPGAGAAGAGSARGIHVTAPDEAAVAIPVGTALTATGVAVPLVALAPGTRVKIEVREDWQGVPSGRSLAAGTLDAGAPGDTVWSSATFDPVVVASGAAWIVVRAEKGEAVWLAAEDESERLRVVRTNGGPPAEVGLDGLRPLFELFTRSGAAAAVPPTSMTVGGVAVQAARVGDRATYDFTAALAAGSGEVPLVFSSSAAGTLTVSPPHVEFRLT